MEASCIYVSIIRTQTLTSQISHADNWSSVKKRVKHNWEVCNNLPAGGFNLVGNVLFCCFLVVFCFWALAFASVWVISGTLQKAKYFRKIMTTTKSMISSGRNKKTINHISCLMQSEIQQFEESWLILTYLFREPKDSVSFPNISWITRIQTEMLPIVRVSSSFWVPRW